MTKNTHLNVYVFNVGQGDHILIEFPPVVTAQQQHRSFGIIDINEVNTEFGLKIPAILFLENIKEPFELKFIALSHYDTDHIKGLDNFIEELKLKKSWTVENCWLAGTEDQEYLKEDLMARLLKKNGPKNFRINRKFKAYKSRLEKLRTFLKLENINLEYASGFNKMMDEDGVRVLCLAPLQKYLRKFVSKVEAKLVLFFIESILNVKLDNTQEEMEAEDKGKPVNRNMISSVLRFDFPEYNGPKLIFGGDALKDSLEESIVEFDKYKYAKEFGNLEASFIKAFHHGSSKSSSIDIWKAFLNKNGTCFVVFSAGRNKKYQHPNQASLDHIKNAAKKLKSVVYYYATNFNFQTYFDQDEYWGWWPYPKKTRKKNALERDRKQFREIDGIRSEFYSEQESKALIAYKFEFDIQNEKYFKVRKILRGNSNVEAIK